MTILWLLLGETTPANKLPPTFRAAFADRNLQLKSNDLTSPSDPLLLSYSKKLTEDATELQHLPCLRVRGPGCHQRRRAIGFTMGLKIAAMRKDEQSE